MGRGIDAASHAADDGQTGVRQVGREPLGDSQAVGRGAARPHHAERDRLQQFHTPARVQQNRRIEDLAQRLRIARVAHGDHHGSGLRHLLLLRHGVFKRAAAGDGLRHRTAHAGGLQFRARGAEDGLRSPGISFRASQ